MNSVHGRLLAAVCLPVILAATGCLKLVASLAINKDSSGQLELKYSVNEDSVAQAKGLIELKNQLSFSSSQTRTAGEQWVDLLLTPTENGFRNRFKTYEALGVKLDSIKVTSENAQRNVQLSASFRSLTLLSRADFFHETGVSLNLTPEGNYILKREKLPDNAAADMTMNADTVALLSPVLNGFNATFHLTPPGKILKSNGTVTQNTASWTFDYNAEPASLLALQRNELNATFEGGRDINLPLIRTR